MAGLVHNPTLDLLRLNNSEITNLLSKAWIAPSKLSQEIRAVIQGSPLYDACSLSEINVAGAPDSQFLYTMDSKNLIILKPNFSSMNQPFIQELIEEYQMKFQLVQTEISIFYISGVSDQLAERLRLPRVLLINLFHPEMYPTFRLTLGISSIASFLRHHNIASVDMIDCQFGTSVREVVEQIFAAQPNIVGLSVNFGQMDLMEQLLDSMLYESPLNYKPTIVLGNILPSLCAEAILEKYPSVIICSREGEVTLAELSRKHQMPEQWNTIPNICYKNANNKTIRTQAHLLSLDLLPPPALDTVEALLTREGVLTAEFSRGCQYNVCTFCPRTHKGNAWRSLPVSSMIRQATLFKKVSHQFHAKPHIFLADEEFVGPDQEGTTLERIYSLLEGLQSRNISVSFDASCRVDQIYDHAKDNNWHVNRGKLFKSLASSGLSRLFVGIESGANRQLERYRKGYSSESIISAIRFFSLLGVRLRFGFIFFDPLMTIDDLCDNIEFLGRTDVILEESANEQVEDIFAFVKQSHGKYLDQKVSSLGAVYENVSYMVSPLELLPKSKYLLDLARNKPQLLTGGTDVNFARVHARYVVPEIEILSEACQVWINFCFPIVYTLKGLQKVSNGDHKLLLGNTLKTHRFLSFMLVRNLAEILSLVHPHIGSQWELAYPTPHQVLSLINNPVEFEKKKEEG